MLHSVLVALIFALAAAADLPELKRHQVVVQVHGIVCSFCAHGAEKSLRRLPDLNKELFGADGILVDIATHRITISMQPDKYLPVALIFSKIRKAGYDPIIAYLRLAGSLTRSAQGLQFKALSGQRFRLLGKAAETLPLGAELEVVVAIDAAAVAAAQTAMMTAVYQRKL
jgi:hypothetical protein